MMISDSLIDDILRLHFAADGDGATARQLLEERGVDPPVVKWLAAIVDHAEKSLADELTREAAKGVNAPDISPREIEHRLRAAIREAIAHPDVASIGNEAAFDAVRTGLWETYIDEKGERRFRLKGGHG